VIKLPKHFDLKISESMTMANVPANFAIRAAVANWPLTRILQGGKDITESLVNCQRIETKLVVRLDGIADLVMLPGQEIPENCAIVDLKLAGGE
jgi:hypothetical protein